MVQRYGFSRFGWSGSFFGWCILWLIQPGFVAAEESKDLTSLLARVDPCVATIKLPHSQGSGFVVEASGIIVTNYHVIEGAKEAVAIFPDKSSYAIKGFLVVEPKWDMAILRIEPNGKPLPVLSFSKGLPGKGERVFAFGSPLGMGGSVSEGIVAALRTGEELSTIMREGGGKDVFTEVLGYDKATQWIQTTTPISPGNSGGPLVNAQGEVLGINTWQNRMGQNINFTISATHVQELLKKCGSELHALSTLPPARHHDDLSDAGKTLAVWKQLNRLMYDLKKKVAPCEKRLAAITPADPRNPARGLNNRMKRKADQFHALGQVYTDFSGKVKELKTADIDPKLVGFTIVEADFSQRITDLCEKAVTAANSQSEMEFLIAEKTYQQGVPRAAAKLRTAHDLLRAELALAYHKEFPTIEQTAKEPEADEGETAKPEPKSEDAADRSAMRTWTDSSGTHHIQAKLQSIKDGKVNLERSDGHIITLPVEKLSDADRRFIGKEK